MKDQYFEEEVMPRVLANETTCRSLINILVARGVEISIDPKSLSHDECIEVVIQIMSELKRSERHTKPDNKVD